MDANQFDDLVRTIPGSRRALLSLGAAIGLVPVLGDARKRKKKKKKRCKSCPICRRCKRGRCRLVPSGTACGPAGAVCLANGSCATACTAAADCPDSECVCGGPSVEGPSFCAQNELFLCEGLTVCTSTAACAAGLYCQQTLCPGIPHACLPLCGA